MTDEPTHGTYSGDLMFTYEPEAFRSLFDAFGTMKPVTEVRGRCEHCDTEFLIGTVSGYQDLGDGRVRTQLQCTPEQAEEYARHGRGDC